MKPRFKFSRNKNRNTNDNIGKKGHKLKIFLLVVIVVLAIVAACVGYITDFLWFKELGYLSVFFKKLITQLKIGIPVFLLVTIVSYVYFKLIKKGYYKKIISDEIQEKKSLNIISWIMAAVFGGVVTVFTTSKLWFSWLQFANSSDFGYNDPLFGMDVSFYIFKLDFLEGLTSLAILLMAMFIVFTLIYYMMLIGMRPPRIFEKKTENPFEEFDPFSATQRDTEYSYETEDPFNQGTSGSANPFEEMLKGTPFEKFASNFGKPKKKKEKKKLANDNIKQLFSIASTQLTVAGVLLFVMLGVHFFLKQYDLLYAHNGAVYGAGYTDVHVTLLVYRILAGLSLIGAVAVVVGIKKHRVKLIAAIPIIMIIVNFVGVGAAAGIQYVIVSGDEIAKESKYLERNIEFTQKAYDLENVTVKSFAASNDLTAEDIKNNDATISNIRINDYLPAEKFYNQTQSIRQYYTFKDVDVDRYMVNGEYTQTFLSAREIDEEKISQTWLNKHLKYTHGYGITLSRVDEITASGQPKMLIDNIPPQSDVEEIEITRPEIYFGEMTNQYAIVGTDEDEFDYPNGDSNEYSRYEGSAGIKLNMINRVLFALEERNAKILVSSNIDSNSRIIINRNIMDRVEKIMPYLQYDKDPYIVTAGGKLYWMIDAYTTSSRFPYSEPYDVENTDTNYIRNSVKVVIDAYNGNIDYYITDADDPIAETFKKIYPKLFKDGSEMPEELKSHVRYPNTLFETQAKVYSRYHMNDVRVFYQNEDLWEIAYEIYGTEEKQMEPNYFIMNLPGEKNAEFVNSIPFSPKDKKNMTGLLVARNDGDNYGELVLYQFPKSKVVYGPRQVEATIDQDTEISKDFSLWSSAGSTYSRGNMFVIPIEDSILYVEPVYLEASDSSIPEVKRVIVVYGDEIAYEETLGEALESLFGEGASPEKEESEDDESLSRTELIDKANQAFTGGQEALKNGNWAGYGKYMDQLEEYLNMLKQ